MQESKKPRSGRRMSVSRRTVLKGMGAAAGGALVGGFPHVWANKLSGLTIRAIGAGTSTVNEIAERAKQDLGLTVEMTALDTDAIIQRVVTQPKSFDVVDSDYAGFKKMVPTGNIQPMDVKRIERFDQIVPIFTTGRMPDGKKISDLGSAPRTISFLTGQDSTEFASEPTDWFTVIPTIYNADTLGIRPDLVSKPVESWGDLFDEAFRGKASIINVSHIGILDAAMACQALGLVEYRDMGNMSREEIDRTIDVLIDLKRQGHWRAFWKSFDESVNLMASGEVVIQSMWSPAITAVKSRGVACNYIPLKEGYRSWAAGLAVSRATQGIELDAVYEYLNWYLSGWAGAFLLRQGYYPAVLGTAKEHMSADEWGYWMEGKPAGSDIADPFGNVMDKAGNVRDGGSFEQRMGATAIWNAVMDENIYMVRRWNEFIAA